MAQYSIGEALSKLFEEAKWKPRMHEIKLRDEWESIVGTTIAKYTRELKLSHTVLYLSTDIAPLKNEILLSKQDIITRINAHLGERVISDIVVR